MSRDAWLRVLLLFTGCLAVWCLVLVAALVAWKTLTW